MGTETARLDQSVVDLDKVIHGEVAENVFRQDFRPSEMVAIARALEPILRKEAKARQGTRTDLRENFPDVDGGRARDKLGQYVGVSGRTLEKMVPSGTPSRSLAHGSGRGSCGARLRASR